MRPAGGCDKTKMNSDHIKEVRLLVIIDVFEALTARDRPYKNPMPEEKALGILYRMAENGEIDMEILRWFEASQAWTERGKGTEG